MSKRVIRVGDTTNHGGMVLASGALHFTVNDIPMSLVGVPCTCSKKGHKHCKIATGDAGHTIGSVAIASEGCLTTCDATLVATMPNFATTRRGIQATRLRDFSRQMLAFPKEKGVLTKNPAVRQIDIFDSTYENSKTIFER